MSPGENRYKCLFQLYKLEDESFRHLFEIMIKDKNVSFHELNHTVKLFRVSLRIILALDFVKQKGLYFNLRTLMVVVVCLLFT